MAWVIVITALTTVLLTVVVMNFATPEKKLERKVEHRFGIADPQFQREMSVMMGPSILPGNRITPLQNGAEIFPAMLAAIRGAAVSVTFETYIYWSGEIGQEFSDALAEQARAGTLTPPRFGSARAPAGDRCWKRASKFMNTNRR
jgi:cardiolipin synthase